MPKSKVIRTLAVSRFSYSGRWVPHPSLNTHTYMHLHMHLHTCTHTHTRRHLDASTYELFLAAPWTDTISWAPCSAGLEPWTCLLGSPRTWAAWTSFGFTETLTALPIWLCSSLVWTEGAGTKGPALKGIGSQENFSINQWGTPKLLPRILFLSCHFLSPLFKISYFPFLPLAHFFLFHSFFKNDFPSFLSLCPLPFPTHNLPICFSCSSPIFLSSSAPLQCHIQSLAQGLLFWGVTQQDLTLSQAGHTHGICPCQRSSGSLLCTGKARQEAVPPGHIPQSPRPDCLWFEGSHSWFTAGAS